jgi:UDP-N-acetylmuramate dehydrogenase
VWDINAVANSIQRINVRGRLLADEPMSRHCSWRTGGKAERFFEPADIDDLVDFLHQVDRSEPLTWIGLGSNVLVRDGGIDGTVVATPRTMNTWRWLDAARLYVECGVACAKVAKEAFRQQLGGGSFLGGIPGTIGGALAMNAGAFGREIWMLVESVELLDRDGERQLVDRQRFTTAYRSVDVPAEHWFVSTVLRFDPEPAAEERDVRALLGERNASQPTGQASCGSVFKNPPGDFAGRLIEAAGLKGSRRGGCHVSDKHANFIINDAAASAADIERLMLDVQAAVAQKFGQQLEPEVRIVGRPGTRPGGGADDAA